MTAILAEFAHYLTPPNVLAVSPDLMMINIFAVAAVAAAGVWAAIALRKPRDAS